jgi:signal transduction histidine kinase
VTVSIRAVEATRLTAGAAEALALAAFVLAGSGGSLTCASEGACFVVRLPAAAEQR